MRPLNLALAVLLFAMGCLARPGPGAAQAACPQHFAGGVTPVLTNPKLAPKTRQICYSEFALLHSGITRTPLWVAEHLNPERAHGARILNRVSNFHPDPNLPADERAELSDYARSGFDRGHMAPAGDMSTPEAMEESFSLANMVPQDPDNNRNLWESIERVVRDLSQERELYVVTGPLFLGENLQSLKGRVLVPTHLAKAVYDPQRNAGAAYLVPNQAGNDFRIVSLAELQQLSGIDVFPQLSQEIKQVVADLPTPRVRQQRGRTSSPPRPSPAPREVEAGPSDGDFVESILDAIDQIGRRP